MDEALRRKLRAGERRSAAQDLLRAGRAPEALDLLGELWVEGDEEAGSLFLKETRALPGPERVSAATALRLERLAKAGRQECLDVWWREIFPQTWGPGGPLILLPEELLQAWQGASNIHDPTDEDTDYGRACIPLDLARIDVGDGVGLLFPPNGTALNWIPYRDGGAAVIEWLTSESDDTDAHVLGRLESVPDAEYRARDLIFEVEASRVFLFHAAYSGSEALAPPEPHLAHGFDMAPGRYAIETADIRDERVNVAVVRLRPC